MKTLILATAVVASTFVFTVPASTAWAGFIIGGNGFVTGGNGFNSRGNGWKSGKSNGGVRLVPPKRGIVRLCRIGTRIVMIDGQPVKKPIYGPCR